MSNELNFEKVWAALMETRERQEEDRKRAKETREELREEMREAWREMRESAKETDRVVKKVSRLVGGVSNNNGSVAEEYFYNAFNRTMSFAREHFDYIERNKEISNSRQRAEFDIMMNNGDSLAIIEVKYKAHMNDIQKVLTKKEQLRDIVSSSKDKTIYLGLAGLSFPLDVEQATLDAGIAVIKQVGDIVVVQDERVKKF